MENESVKYVANAWWPASRGSQDFELWQQTGEYSRRHGPDPMAAIRELKRRAQLTRDCGPWGWYSNRCLVLNEN